MCDYMNNMGDTIAQTRLDMYTWLKKNKITQETGASLLGITRSHFNKVLNGSTQPSLYLLERMIELMEE